MPLVSVIKKRSFLIGKLISAGKVLRPCLRKTKILFLEHSEADTAHSLPVSQLAQVTLFATY